MKRATLLFFFLLLSVFVFGQAFKISPISTDSVMYKSQVKIVADIQIIGNKTTKEQIIFRELSFKKGDTLTNQSFINALEQSKKNLHNTSLFNFVEIDWALIDSIQTQIIVNLHERWYTFPAPIFQIDDNNFNTWWKSKDFSRINYGLQLVQYNFRGRKEKLSFTAQFGFTERLKLNYDIPYISKTQKGGLSFSFSYNRRDEIVYTSENNKRLQYKNFNGNAVRNYAAGITYQYRPAIYNKHRVGAEYDFVNIQDTVRKLNPNYLGNNSREKQFFSLYYSFTHDRRDSKSFPLKGNFFQLSLKKYGLGILDDDIDLTNIQFQIKKYEELAKRLYFAAGVRGILTTNNNQPYLLQNGMGYSQAYTLRAYEYYVIDGQNLGLAKAEVRYQIIRPRHANINAMPIKKFQQFHYALYGGIFSDFGYIEDNTGFENNKLANDFQYGYGVGLDFVSYYDIVIRTEFSLNKFGESGIFLHFVASI